MWELLSPHQVPEIRPPGSSTHTTHMDTGANMVNEVLLAEEEAAGEEEEEEEAAGEEEEEEEAYFRTEHVSRTEELQMEVESATKVTP